MSRGIIPLLCAYRYNRPLHCVLLAQEAGGFLPFSFFQKFFQFHATKTPSHSVL